MFGSVLASFIFLVISVFWKRHWLEVYRNNGLLYLLKYIICNIILWIAARCSQRRRLDVCTTGATENPVKFGILCDTIEWKMDIPRPQALIQKAADSIQIYGSNQDKEFIFVQMTVSSEGLMESWLYLRVGGTTYAIPRSPTLTYSTFDKFGFKSKGLEVTCKAPFRKWRVAYTGLLRTCSDNLSKEVHIKIGMTWTALSAGYDFAVDVPDVLLTNTFSSIPWKRLQPDFERLKRTIDGHGQSGHLMGSLTINGQEKEKQFWGTRTRTYGERLQGKGYSISTLNVYTENGSALSLISQSCSGYIEKFVHGYVVKPSGHVSPITESDISLEESLESLFTKSLRVKSGKEEYVIKIQQDGPKSQLISEAVIPCPKFTIVQSISVDINNSRGFGVVVQEKERILDKALRLPKQIPFPMATGIQSESPLVTSLASGASQNLFITGGKGSSLAKLKAISGVEKSFIVPNAIIVTCEAHKQVLKNKSIAKYIKHMENIAWDRFEGNLDNACESTAREVRSSKLPEPIRAEIESNLVRQFRKDTVFAIRSSAVGEDSGSLSCAGLMETFLGVKGIDEICKAVMKCWASQYELMAVLYKRQYGQHLNTPMAVIIQEMVEADVAGVLFTCDPITGNPASVTISANYGLGESVVSSSSDPDCITLKRNADDRLQFDKIQPGKKKTKIVIDDEKGGTKKEVLSSTEQRQSCLANEEAIALGKVSLEIENYFGYLLDIEWAVMNKHVYILQARPVTSINVENDIELITERDGPIRTAKEALTTANYGEGLPGYTTPLTYSSTFACFNLSGARHTSQRTGQKMAHVQVFGSASVKGHLLLNLIDGLYRSATKDKSKFNEAQSIALFGKIIEDQELRNTALERYSGTHKAPWSGLLQLFYLTYDVWKAKEMYEKAHQKYWDFKIPTEKFQTAEELYCELCSQLTKIEDPTLAHIKCTGRSAILNMVLLTILSKVLKGWTPQVYSTFAKLVQNPTSSEAVESADVPAAIQNLAELIADVTGAEFFATQNSKGALKWINNQAKLRDKFEKFLLKHGHRCWKEFDFYSTTWKTGPEQVITSLQAAVSTQLSKRKSTKHNKTDEPLQDISTSLTKVQRLILKFLIPRSANGIADREASKSLVIKMVDVYRRGFVRLSELMVHEGRLPDQSLLFFFQLEELGILLRTRAPSLISRALRRKRLYTQMDELVIPSIIYGIPTYEDISSPAPATKGVKGTVTVSGTPVSRGTVKGRAIVITNVKNALDIRAGDILITNSTDVGWTPYFPTLGGVVTEIGGLISHGAVVAREYGIPCLVGVENVTQIFKTGDEVMLDSENGTLTKCSM